MKGVTVLMGMRDGGHGKEKQQAAGAADGLGVHPALDVQQN
jgi:hypothetical protein